ncbi:hypothetical protein [Maribacter aquivivus]|uniref:hypothetical protein n=1 Tax=Maribacter aquivivus TaxID=228958 RepID=UPI002494E221|nr:hypothetical protein [Maribacter aquivivus]
MSNFAEVFTSTEDKTSKYLKMINKPIGLQSLIIGNAEVSIKVNARLLNENYFQGFNLNTIEQFREILLNNGIKFNQDFIENSKLSLAHIKNDVEIDINDLIYEFSNINSAKHFRIVRDNNITFESINKGDKIRTNIYGKYNEMIKYKSKYKPLNLNIENYRGMTRVETKLDDSRTIRKYLNTRNTLEILMKTNFNSNVIDKIIKDHPLATPKVNINQFKTISQLDDYARTKLLFELSNGDFHLMKKELKDRLGKNTKASYQTNKLQKYLPLVQNPTGQKLTNIIELKKKLKEQ